MATDILKQRLCSFSLCPLPAVTTVPSTQEMLRTRSLHSLSRAASPSCSVSGSWTTKEHILSLIPWYCYKRGPGCLGISAGSSCLKGRTCWCLLTPLIFAFDHQLSHSKGQDAALGDGYSLLVVYGSLGLDSEELCIYRDPKYETLGVGVQVEGQAWESLGR